MKKVFAMILALAMVVSMVPSSKVQATEADWPKQTITIVVPFAAGGSTDLLARVMADEMKTILGVNVIVNNIAGASGTTGTGEVAAAAPDGYTLIFNASGPVCTQPWILDNLTYSLEDFRGIAGIAYDCSCIAVNAESPYQTFEEMVNSGDALMAGNTGNGTVHQLVQTAVQKATGMDMTLIPFQGGAALVTAVLGNQVSFGTTPPSEFASALEAGSVRILAVSSAERSPLVPDVPTLKELGIDVDMTVSYFLLAPAGVPDEVAAKLEEAALLAAESEAVQEFIQNTGYTYSPLNGEDLMTKLTNDLAVFGELMTETTSDAQ